MPNTSPYCPILTGKEAEEYRWEIISHIPSGVPFEPLMTIQITNSTTSEIIREAREKVVVAGKIYPVGVTTNSRNGVTSLAFLYPVFKAMEELGMVLSVHGEMPGAFCLDKEKLYLRNIAALHADFPDLKIVLEHITTREGRDFILSCGKNVAATITVHHLLLTLDDVLGNFLEPHNFCKPIAKYPEDRDALLEAATSEDPRFFFGSDSAPHLRHKKECAQGQAGIFSAPTALSLLVGLFEAYGKLRALEKFTSISGAQFYGLPINTNTIRFTKKEWIVPQQYDNIVPFMAGKTISWQMAQ